MDACEAYESCSYAGEASAEAADEAEARTDAADAFEARMDAAEAIEARFRGRTHPIVRNIIDAQWWRAARASEALDDADVRAPLPREAFLRMMSKIHIALLDEDEEWDKSEATSFAHEWWAEYARGAAELTRTRFTDALFELVVPP
jgi:hypothetical protein